MKSTKKVIQKSVNGRLHEIPASLSPERLPSPSVTGLRSALVLALPRQGGGTVPARPRDVRLKAGWNLPGRILGQSILFLLFFSLLCGMGKSHAEEDAFDPKLKELCNEVVMSIYQEIEKEKARYPELENFDKSRLTENQYGIYQIDYEYTGEARDKAQTPYRFGLTIDRMKDVTFEQSRDSFNFGFPLLDVKFSGYQRKHLLRTQFDVLPLIQKYGDLLAGYQQEYLPLRLELRTIKDTYHVREDVEFEVILKNVSKRHMIVKGLGQSTLFFLFDNQYWGTRPTDNSQGGESVILKSGESIHMRFKGESFQKPHKFEIFSVYLMSIKGVNPTGTLKVSVVDE